jgi:hypothetical protein
MTVLKDALDNGTPLLSWQELNIPALAFGQYTAIAYPEAYSVMAFLADRYGMGDFSAFLVALKRGNPWSSALETAYGQSARRLQIEWQAYLPDFVKTGWQTNLLTYYDLGPGVALYDAGQFKQAVAHFTQSKSLYEQLGRTERAQAASDYLDKARIASDATDRAAIARTALERYDYQTAYTDAQRAAQAFGGLDLAVQASAANDTLALAQKGLDGLASLENAKAHMNGLGVLSARPEAEAAAQVFAELGDTAHSAEATQLISQLSGVTSFVGFGALGAGALALLIGAVVGVRRWYDDLGRMRAKKAGARLVNDGEENAQWM